MEITAQVAEHLRVLCGDPDRGDQFVAALGRLAGQVARAVPSCLAVSLTLARLGAEITVGDPARSAGTPPVAVPVPVPVPVLASLAVPLSAGQPGDVLILRAADAGAFARLADDLGDLLDGGLPPITVDGHLHWPPAGGDASLSAALAELRAVNQAIGVLIDRGWEPAAAGVELRRRADRENSTLGVAGRRLLEFPPPRPEPR